MEETKHYCDICGREVSCRNDICDEITVNEQSKLWQWEQVCPKCVNAIIEFISERAKVGGRSAGKVINTKT